MAPHPTTARKTLLHSPGGNGAQGRVLHSRRREARLGPLSRVATLLGLSSLSWEVEPGQRSGELELALLVDTTGTALPDPSLIGNFHRG